MDVKKTIPEKNHYIQEKNQDQLTRKKRDTEGRKKLVSVLLESVFMKR